MWSRWLKANGANNAKGANSANSANGSNSANNSNLALRDNSISLEGNPRGTMFQHQRRHYHSFHCYQVMIMCAHVPFESGYIHRSSEGILRAVPLPILLSECSSSPCSVSFLPASCVCPEQWLLFKC